MILRVNRLANAGGFSLVEILLVIVIILMLAGALVVYVLPQQEGAERDTTRLKLQSIQSALELYRTNIRSYPTEEQGGLEALMIKPTFENEKVGDRWARQGYLTRGTTLDDAWGHPLRYDLVDRTLDPDGPDFRLYSVGPDGQPETEDDVTLYDDDDDISTRGGPGGGGSSRSRVPGRTPSSPSSSRTRSPTPNQ